MSPRRIEGRRCPHCGAELPEPKPAACPECMGSLQKRHLTLGCLTSKPLLALVAWGAWQAFGAGDAGPVAAEGADERPAVAMPSASGVEAEGNQLLR